MSALGRNGVLLARRIDLLSSVRRCLGGFSQLLPGPERVRSSVLLEDPNKTISIPKCDTKTVVESLYRGRSIAGGSSECLGTLTPDKNSFVWITFDEMIRQCVQVAYSLELLGIKPGTNIGLYSKNREEFTVCLYAASMALTVPVPMYDTMPLDNILFIINHGEQPLVMCDSLVKVKDLLDNRDQVKMLQTIVSFEPLTEELKSAAEKAQIQLLQYSYLMELDTQSLSHKKVPKAGDVFTICYTSGTTGRPKGAVITNAGIMATLAGVLAQVESMSTPRGSVFSYLPTAHIYEVFNQLFNLYEGRKIGFFSGDMLNILQDMKTLGPTEVPLVPRLMNRLYNEAMTNIKSSFIKRNLLNVALRRKQHLYEKGIVSKSTIWDRLVFKDFQSWMGGNQSLITTTSAPISKDVFQFFQLASGAHVINVYGQTELGAATCTFPKLSNAGTVGGPISCCQVKLTDVPELSYFSKDDVGEICIRGGNVFEGYYKNPDTTNSVFDKDGWLHTGDIGKWLPNGLLTVIDRKKHIFKLSQGEYLAPEKIENVYATSSLIAQIFIDGFPDQDFAIAIIVPEQAAFEKYLSYKGIVEKDYDTACNSRKAREQLLKHLHKIGARAKLNSLEQVRNVYIKPDLLTTESGILTPTLKMKRGEARKLFQKQIDDMYKEGQIVKSKKT